MKNVQLKLQNIEGVKLLSREQLKGMMGGLMPESGGDCKVTNTAPDGTVMTWNYTYTGNWSCAEMSADAGGRADDIQISNGGRTRYDCGCDGWGS